MEKQIYYIKCACCGQIIPISMYPEDLEKIEKNNGELIQNIVPYLPPGERELFISGYCEDCWNRIFQED